MSEILKDKLLKVNRKIFDDYVNINGKTIRLEKLDVNKHVAYIKRCKNKAVECYNKAGYVRINNGIICRDAVDILEKEGYMFDLTECISRVMYVDTAEERILINGEKYVYEDKIVAKKVYHGNFVFYWTNPSSLSLSFQIMSNIVANAKANNYRKSLEDKYSKILFDDVQKELKEVEAEINKIAEKGFYQVIYDGDLYYQTVKELEKAGYKVEFDDVETRYKKVTVVVDAVEGKDKVIKDKVIEVKVYKGKFRIQWYINERYFSFDIREVE